MRKILGKNYYEVKDVAEELGVSIQAVHGWIRAGKLKTSSQIKGHLIAPYRLKEFITGIKQYSNGTSSEEREREKEQIQIESE